MGDKIRALFMDHEAHGKADLAGSDACEPEPYNKYLHTYSH